MTEPKSKPNAPSTYRDAGVDIDAGNALVEAIKPLAKATLRPGAGADLGGFGGLFDLKRAGFVDPILVASNDGVGTKLMIAIETGRHSTIGIDLVAMCANDLLAQGAEPLFFLDYFACGALDVEVARSVVEGIAEGCRQAGCALIGGETAEMPGLYAKADYDLAGFAVGAVERDRVLPRSDIGAGDVLLGLPSSGVHSNGYSLVRRVVYDLGVSWTSPSGFSPGQSFAEVLLAPTRIYVRPVLAAIRETGAIKAVAHVTGGGLPENVPRILPEGLAAVVDLSSWSAPPVFQWLQESTRLDAPELLRTFNCGIGLVLAVGQGEADRVVACLAEHGESAIAIGSVIAGGGTDARRTQAKGRGETEALHLTGHFTFAGQPRNA